MLLSLYLENRAGRLVSIWESAVFGSLAEQATVSKMSSQFQPHNLRALSLLWISCSCRAKVPGRPGHESALGLTQTHRSPGVRRVAERPLEGFGADQNRQGRLKVILGSPEHHPGELCACELRNRKLQPSVSAGVTSSPLCSPWSVGVHLMIALF